MAQKVAIGADHGGFRLKEKLKKYLKKKGYAIKDLIRLSSGTPNPASPFQRQPAIK